MDIPAIKYEFFMDRKKQYYKIIDQTLSCDKLGKFPMTLKNSSSEIVELTDFDWSSSVSEWFGESMGVKKFPTLSVGRFCALSIKWRSNGALSLSIESIDLRLISNEINKILNYRKVKGPVIDIVPVSDIFNFILNWKKKKVDSNR